MARSLYGATPADVTFSSAGGLAPGASVTVWTAREGGTRITNLQALGGAATTVAVSDAHGFLAFYGPDNYTATLWADGGVGSRVALFPVEASNAADFLAASTLSAFGDVDTSGALDGEVLTYDSATEQWVPAPSEGLPTSVIQPFAYWDPIAGEWQDRPDVAPGQIIFWIGFFGTPTGFPPTAQQGDIVLLLPGTSI